MERSAVAMTALGCAIATALANLVAAFVGINGSTTGGMWIRTALVIAVMLVVASRSANRRDAEGFPLPEVVGLCIGWALNPFSWIGRSFVGQWWADGNTALAMAFDFGAWIVTAILIGLAVNRVRSAQDVAGVRG